jgi:tetratricopeptide (TPR) repeat protein
MKQGRSMNKSVFQTGMILGAILALVLPAMAQDADPDARMRSANQAYERGDYPEAIELYRGILDEGLESADLYYNLGNAYMKAGQLGWAVLNYERALRLNPRDEDTDANLEYARARMVDVLPEQKSPWILTILVRAHNLLAPRQLLWLVSALWFVIVILAIVSLYRERLRPPIRTVNIVLAAVLAVLLTSLAFRIHSVEARHPAIVVADEVQVMSGPGEEYAREFVLHAGTKVEIRRSYQNWHEVALSDEMRGWVGTDAIEGI